jgi:3-dehydrosphinganine reductase
MNLSGKTALITGGSSGIGLATARLLAASGTRCGLLARDPARLQTAVESLPAVQTGPHLALPADVTDSQQVQQAVERLISEIGSPDILVNCAGVAHPGYVQDLPLEIYHQMMDVNYFGAVIVTKAILPAMLARCSGHIVNIASMVAFVNVFGYTAYGASKFALRGFSDALRHEMKPHGITVSIVYPPDTDTPQLAYENQFKPPELKMLLPELGTLQPEQVAQTIVRGIQRRQQVILPDFGTHLLFVLNNLLGTKTYAVVDFFLARALKKLKKT